MSTSKTKDSILSFLKYLETQYRYQQGKNIDEEQVFELMGDLRLLFEMYIEENVDVCTKIIKSKYIPILNLLIKISSKQEHQLEYLKQLENAYRLGARWDLECFIIYYEWNEDDKLYEKRYGILNGYVYYLNEMAHRRVTDIIANLPSGYGKTRTVKFYEAFRLGLDPKGTFLSLCSNDTVVKGGSRSVIDIIKNERYGEIFPDNSYQTFGKDLFLKETDGEWKLKDCAMLATYYASTTNSNVVGQRASLSVNIDDLYKDYKEAMDENLNVYYFNNFKTVWKKRYIQNKEPQIIISGTMWSPTDFITKVIDLYQSESEFIPDKKFKYIRISKDGKRVIIQIPALDPETDMSTCEELRSTEALRKERKSMDTYLWETNFQQNPTSPEGLEFDWNSIKLYEEKPQNIYNCTYSVIDGTRKSGKDFFAMPIYQDYYEDYALIDCIFTKTATSELIDDIVEKIIEHHIIKLVVETNVDGGLKRTLTEKLHARGCYFCEIFEKYNTIPKKIRIEAEKGVIKKKIWFPHKNVIEANTDMSKYMQNLTLYNSAGRNVNDDAPDSSAMFCSEIVEEKSKPRKAKAIKRTF
jgi:hypothetical protein